jgi:hypothetical protein
VKFCDVALTEGMSGIFYSIQAASRSAHAEEIYAEFGEPHDRRILESVAGRSILTIVHCHGDALMFDRLARLPGHAWNWDDRRTAPTLGDGSGEGAGRGDRRTRSVDDAAGRHTRTPPWPKPATPSPRRAARASSWGPAACSP